MNPLAFTASLSVVNRALRVPGALLSRWPPASSSHDLPTPRLLYCNRAYSLLFEALHSGYFAVSLARRAPRAERNRLRSPRLRVRANFVCLRERLSLVSCSRPHFTHSTMVKVRPARASPARAMSGHRPRSLMSLTLALAATTAHAGSTPIRRAAALPRHGYGRLEGRRAGTGRGRSGGCRATAGQRTGVHEAHAASQGVCCHVRRCTVVFSRCLGNSR